MLSINSSLFIKNGFELVDNFIDQQTVWKIRAEIENYNCGQKCGGIRNSAKKLPSVKAYLSSSAFLSKIQPWFNAEVKVVRSIVFDKSETNNWLVAWHQDRTVAVSQKFSSDGWGPWSVKDDTHHVQPPLEVLDSMLTFRIHLDDAMLDNGCLRVIPESHMKGVLSASGIKAFTSISDSVTCQAKAGSALVMHPLVIHASSKTTSFKPRRVLHVECSSYTLPIGIDWT